MARSEAIRTQCRFCGKEIWAQSDNGEPECEECGDMAAKACHDSVEVEETLHPLTVWQWWEV